MEVEQLYRELAHGAEMIRVVAAGFTQTQAQVKPDPDSWSVLEVICHLLDEEREDFRVRLDYILHRPGEDAPPIDPAGWVTARCYKERDLAETLRQFLAERQVSLDWLAGLSNPNWHAEFKAPWGSIFAGDMLAAWVAHDGLHLRQLLELRRTRLLGWSEPFNLGYAGDW